jgi:ATP-binding cassette subfamily G (WHITE) protein 2
MAYVLATGYVASSILLSGFYLRISAIKIGFIRALSWLSYTKYAMQAMGRIQLLGATWDPSTCTTTPTGHSPPLKLLE